MKLSSAVFLLFCLAMVASARTMLGSRAPENAPEAQRFIPQRRASPNQPISFFVALKQRNLDELEAMFWAVSDPDHEMYRQFKTIEEINAVVAPSAEDKKVVLQWLHEHGATRVKDNGDAFFVITDARTASALFDTDFHVWEHDNGNKRVLQVNEYSVPSEIASRIDFVEGLTEFPVPGYTAKPSPQSPDVLVSIVPESISTIYKIPKNMKNQGNSSVCVVEFEDQFFSPQDLSNFAQEMSLDIPALTPNHIVGNNQPSSPGVEATLDIQYAAALGQGADAWFWIEGQGVWLYGFANHLFGYKHAPLIHSISYGWDEEQQCTFGIGGSECERLGVNSRQYVHRVNTEFQKIGIRGISLICASGDSGANGRTDEYCTEGHLNPSYPAASPYITAVGATQISQSSGVANLQNPPTVCSQGYQCASAGYEESVSYDQANFASGGGFSYVASVPNYQKTAVSNYFKSNVQMPPGSYYNSNGRGFPDVAAFGSNVLVYQGSIQPVGGTSCSSPIFAGMMSLINGEVVAKTGRPLGFLNPLLYKMAAASPGTFHDITKGNNACTESGCAPSCKGFNAAPGWDPVSGLGSPVFDQMVKYIRSVI